MLKRFWLNGKSIPVPIPIRTAGELLAWVSGSLLRQNETVTRFVIDGKDVIELGIPTENLVIDEHSSITMQADSPHELSLHILDAARNICTVVERQLKPLAVECWQTLPPDVPSGLGEIVQDVSMIQELSSNFRELIAENQLVVDLRSFSACAEVLEITCSELRKKRDWQSVARLLLNDLEPKLQKYNEAAADVQSNLYSMIAELATVQATGMRLRSHR